MFSRRDLELQGLANLLETCNRIDSRLKSLIDQNRFALAQIIAVVPDVKLFDSHATLAIPPEPSRCTLLLIVVDLACLAVRCSGGFPLVFQLAQRGPEQS